MTIMPTNDISDLTEVVGDLEIPCDYSDRPWHQGETRKADWVAQLRVCGCGTSGQRLMCSPCKDMLLVDDVNAFICPSCSGLWVPARAAFSYFEAL